MATSTLSLESVASLAPEDPASLLIGQDSAIHQIAHHTQRAAQVECTVLITGETGTGKEVWARLLHRLGPRQDKPFVPVNCAALTATTGRKPTFRSRKRSLYRRGRRKLGRFSCSPEWHGFSRRNR